MPCPSSFSHHLRTLLAALFRLTAPIAASADEIRIGVLAWLDAEDAEIEWSPFLAALQAALPQHRVQARHLDLTAMGRAVAAGQVDFIVTNPGHYVTLEVQNA